MFALECPTIHVAADTPSCTWRAMELRLIPYDTGSPTILAISWSYNMPPLVIQHGSPFGSKC